jgi:hypothetical protein
MMRETEKDHGANCASTMTVTLDREAKGYRLLIRVEGAHDLIRSDPFTEEQIKQWRQELIECFEKLRDWWRQGRNTLYNCNFGQLCESIKELRVFTNDFLADLFGVRWPSRLGEPLRRARQARIGDLLVWERPIGIIEYEAGLDEFLPLDYLFLPYYKDSNREPKNLHELVLSLSNIVGFSYIVRRNPPWNPDQGSARKRQAIIECQEGQRLIADILANLELQHAEKEIDFFQNANKHVFEVAEDPRQHGAQTAQAIVGRLLGRADVQLHHFCCHCSAESDDPWHHFLRLDVNKAKLSHLKLHCVDYLNDVAPESNVIRRERIAFLNACEGAAVTPLCKSSFPELFLNYFGHIGFVGPEHRIPDAFAYEFARVFYAYLFKLKDLGMALFKTRWFFAKKYQNPMGLFYTLYASGDVRLAGPARSVHL